MSADVAETICEEDAAELNELAKDYAKYLVVDSEKEIKGFYEGIELMLTKLDEFGGLLDTVRSETRDCLDKKVPELEIKCQHMKQIFHRIDQLEMFVNVVRQSVNATEEQVSKAESEMGSLSGLKKMFSSLVGSKKPVTVQSVYQPPVIFNTEDYLRYPAPVVTMDSTTQGEPSSDTTGNQTAELQNQSTENT